MCWTCSVIELRSSPVLTRTQGYLAKVVSCSAVLQKCDDHPPSPFFEGNPLHRVCAPEKDVRAVSGSKNTRGKEIEILSNVPLTSRESSIDGLQPVTMIVEGPQRQLRYQETRELGKFLSFLNFLVSVPYFYLCFYPFFFLSGSNFGQYFSS
ncbi:hypothetical protein TNCT_170331 [Trichonephila clavata]|uniref:Uncharacterized protein n=1 Tax=Trichonephila clavata TaxID=2740835 RepID=A0A8X6FDK5_TRICU|nr:hypothetical protein TNCT_170331 [Trichonephila clavata]